MGGMVTNHVDGASHDSMTAWYLRVGRVPSLGFLLSTQVCPCKTESLLMSKTQTPDVFRVFIGL